MRFSAQPLPWCGHGARLTHGRGNALVAWSTVILVFCAHVGSSFRRASVYRPGHWADDDYDVYDGERIVGRIFRAEAGHRAGTP